MSETKMCRECKKEFPRTIEFFAKKKIGDGFYSYCRPCALVKAREHYAQKQQSETFVQVGKGERQRIITQSAQIAEQEGLLSVSKRNERINCLTCRQCQIEPDTDFDSPMPIIFCKKKPNENGGFGERKMVCLTNCALADPRQARPRELNNIWRKYGPVGDRSKTTNDVMKLYLHRHWPSATPAKLEKQTGFNMNDLRGIINRLREKGEAWPDRRDFCAGRKTNRCANDEQKKLIWQLYFSKHWPGPIMQKMAPETKLERYRTRAKIIALVAERGEHFNWLQIRRIAAKMRYKQALKRRAK